MVDGEAVAFPFKPEYGLNGAPNIFYQFGWRRFRSHFSAPRRKSRKPKGRHIMVTMRAIQPLLVCGPCGPIPPRANLVSRAKKMPVPSVQPPHFNS